MANGRYIWLDKEDLLCLSCKRYLNDYGVSPNMILAEKVKDSGYCYKRQMYLQPAMVADVVMNRTCTKFKEVTP